MSRSLKNLKIGVLPFGILLTVSIGSIFAYNLFIGDKSYFLAGDATHGHYQIQLHCQSCHSEPFSTPEQMQTACENCHAKELDKVNDSHPKKKFLDPRNAELLEKLDARYCVTCHKEHKPEITRKYGVTLAKDFCIHCHQDLAEDKPDHKDFDFMTCTNSGCHNFHDNSMLYEKFLAKHVDEPENLSSQKLPNRTGINRWLKKHKRKTLYETPEPDMTFFKHLDTQEETINFDQATLSWASSVHAQTNTQCSSCHTDETSSNGAKFNIDNTELVCLDCHKKQHKTFLQGKHGLRLSLELSPLSTQETNSEINTEQKRVLGCVSCHDPHSADVTHAAVDGCLECHQDQHSRSYKQSKHFELWIKEASGDLEAGSGVSCASCHLPRIKKGKRVEVIHNQNWNLQPNTKMLRKVCMNCHGLEYSLSALSDEILVNNNFVGKANETHPTYKLIRERLKIKNQSQ